MESLVVVQLQAGFVGVVYGFADVVEVVEGVEENPKADEGVEGNGPRESAGEMFDHVVPKRYIEQWFGEGRLPDGWTKPERPIGHSVLSGGIKEVERIEAVMTRESVAPGAAAARG